MKHKLLGKYEFILNLSGRRSVVKFELLGMICFKRYAK